MKFLTSSLFMIIMVAVGWHYVPAQMKEKLLGAVGIAARGDTAEVKHFIEDVVLPRDPASRRAALAGELAKNIAELRRRMVSMDNASVFSADGMRERVSGDADALLHHASVQDLLRTSEEIVKDFVSVNKDATVTGKVAERILDAVLPVSRAPRECSVK